MDKQTLFISYCWKDGNVYADELESQLKDEFNVKRDKSQLIANDDINEFMAKIANCDNVIIVLTMEYMKSRNCMLEVSFLVRQIDWLDKTMLLVIDESMYSIERKMEVLNYWYLRKSMCIRELESMEIGKRLYNEEHECLENICSNLETFLKEVSRRKNPSQIAVVNEVIKKSRRDRHHEEEMLDKGEQKVKEFLEKYGDKTVEEITDETNMDMAVALRYIDRMKDKKIISVTNSEGKRRYKLQ